MACEPKDNAMAKHDTTPSNAESGKGMAKESTFATFPKSKFTPAYWAERVFRPRYTEDGVNYAEVSEFWARIQQAGRREVVALGTNNAQEAARRAARLYQRVKSAGWDLALKEFAPDRVQTAAGAPTVGDVIRAAEAKMRDVRPGTLRGYCVCFRTLAADAFRVRATKERFDYRGGGLARWRARVDRVRLDRFTPARAQAVINSRIDAHKANPVAQDRARRSVASILRQAKSLFRPGVDLGLGELPNPFDGVKVESAAAPKYDSTIDAGALLRAAKAELAPVDAEAYKALLLALGVGLRKSEIDNLQWQQIDRAGCVIRIATTETFRAKTRSSEGKVYVDPGLVAELCQFHPQATGLYVLESPFAPKPDSRVAFYRAAATFDRLTAWLRTKGVTARKAIHELRKEFGSIVVAAADIHTASRQLRHSSIGTTAAFYADHRRRVAPPVAAMLAMPEATKEEGQA